MNYASKMSLISLKTDINMYHYEKFQFLLVVGVWILSTEENLEPNKKIGINFDPIFNDKKLSINGKNINNICEVLNCASNSKKNILYFF
jgi:hypothetical protein